MRKPQAPGQYRSDVYEVSGTESQVGAATTNEHDEYAIDGLPGGSYHVEFSPGKSGLNYLVQYHNDKPSLATAEPVKVVGAKATEGIGIGRVGRVYGRRVGRVNQAIDDQPLARRCVHDDALAESRTENDD